MHHHLVTLVCFGHFETCFLPELTLAVQKEFQTSVNVMDGHIDLIDYYDPERRQYNGDRLLKIVLDLVKTKDEKVIGLFNVDLYIPILTFIFGQAMLNGSAGIASRYRLNNQWYGLKPDPPLHLERFKKEVIHELGHTFGLIHCLHHDCVMHSSTYVEEIDQKGPHLCQQCRAQLEE